MIAVGALLIEANVLEPRGVGGTHPFFLNILEGEEITSDMVEYTVQDHADTVLMQGLADLFEGRVISRTAVDLSVIDRIITVAGTLEYRIEQDAVDAHLLEMGDKVIDFIQAVVQLKIIVLRCSAEAQRINIIDNCVMNPVHTMYLLFCTNSI